MSGWVAIQCLIYSGIPLKIIKLKPASLTSHWHTSLGEVFFKTAIWICQEKRAKPISPWNMQETAAEATNHSQADNTQLSWQTAAEPIEYKWADQLKLSWQVAADLTNSRLSWQCSVDSWADNLQLGWQFAAELTAELTSGSWADKVHLSRHVADCSWADTLQLSWADMSQPSQHDTAELTCWGDRLQPSWQIMTEWSSTDNVDIVSHSTTTPSSKCSYIKHQVVHALMLCASEGCAWTSLVCFSAHQPQGLSTCMLTLRCIPYVLALGATICNPIVEMISHSSTAMRNHWHHGKLDMIWFYEKQKCSET